jgi:hypothetical protein
MARTEIQRALSLLYNLAHRLLRIDKRYKVAEFAEEAEGIYDLVAAHAELRILLRLASPLAAMGALWEKVEDTLDILRRRKQPKQPAQQQAATAMPMGNNGPTGRAPLAVPKE